MREQIESAYRAWNDAFNRGDAKAVASFYSENAKLLPPTHDVIEGREAIERFWDSLLKAGMTSHTLEMTAVEDDQRGAVGVAKWSARGKGREGAERTFHGSVVHIFAKQQDGGSKIWLHIWN
ncbi:MAG TPA: nuclear transport factor 2 family protein [Geminicoccaceae bacterium]|nr:nuclear transport factor 2 family protein [Geminicoccaceae bacterium]